MASWQEEGKAVLLFSYLNVCAQPAGSFTQQELRLLLYLANRPEGVSAGWIAETFAMNRFSVNTLVTALERQGYLAVEKRGFCRPDYGVKATKKTVTHLDRLLGCGASAQVLREHMAEDRYAQLLELLGEAAAILLCDKAFMDADGTK